VDGAILRRHPVTNAEYLAFLDDLAARGLADLALRRAPRERSGTVGAEGALIYAFDGRKFSLRPDEDGDVWAPDWPVTMVDWAAAREYAHWVASASGLPWRLPLEAEWEKAARGVDGRFYPWGDHYDASWASNSASRPGRPLPSAVTAFPVDESVYGVRGMAGNMQDWCEDPYSPDGERPAGSDGAEDPDVERIVRGGGWASAPAAARLAVRDWFVPGLRYSALGFRLARPFG